MSSATSQQNPVSADAGDAPVVEQLTLLPTSSSTPARFRLSKDTRERGMRHVAEIRRMLAARGDGSSTPADRHDRAA